MKTMSLAVLVSFLLVSGLALASQSAEQKQGPSMMEEMMTNRSQRDHGGGMMGMMKMMEQCAAMMESGHHSEAGNESRKQ